MSTLADRRRAHGLWRLSTSFAVELPPLNVPPAAAGHNGGPPLTLGPGEIAASLASFIGEEQLALTLAGAANLRLLAGLIPDLQTQGQATVNVTVAGTMSSPRITGRARVQDVT